MPAGIKASKPMDTRFLVITGLYLKRQTARGKMLASKDVSLSKATNKKAEP
jgi:hypothetical protein